MVELDCLGDMCPIPMLKLKQCKMLKEGEQIKLVTDHSCVCENITYYCKKVNLHLRVEEPVNGVFEMYISKGTPPQKSADSAD